jgi:acetyltransferase-like isoleucine patch superfamily enzyme
MRNILKRILYRILLYIDNKTNNAKIYYNSRSLILGAGSMLYKETVIYNLCGDINTIIVGKNTHVRGELLTLAYGGKIEIGDNSFIGTGSRIWSGEKISIGSNVLVSHNVNIIDTDSHEINHIERAEGYKNLFKNGYPKEKGSIKTDKITIHNYVWISFNASIMKGVTIGEGAIIGANSVVTKDIPPYSLAVGNPARVIKKLN